MGDETKTEEEATGDISFKVSSTDVKVNPSHVNCVPRFKKQIISVSRLM